MPDTNTLPTPAAAWNGPTVPPFQPQDTSNPPEMDSPAATGLSGGMIGAPAAPAAPPEPHVSVAQHILSALGASSGEPMAWAKSILAGGLAGAANVGTVPSGGGWLTGAARGAAGLQQEKRQAALDESKLADEKMQRTMWNTQVAGETQRQNEAAELFKYAPAEHQAKLQELADEHMKFTQQQLAVFSAAGINLSDYAEIKDSKDLSPEQKQGLLSHPPTLLAVPNGEAHGAGEDNAGVHLVPTEALMGARLKKDMPVSIPATDDKGNPITKTITVVAGTGAMDAAAIIQGAKNAIDAKQTALLRQADVQQAINKNRAEELKNQPPSKDQTDIFLGKTLPGYTHVPDAQQKGLQAEAKAARTVAELDKVQERALQLETLGTNRELAQSNMRANKETSIKSELGKKGVDDVIKTWTDPQHGFTQVQAQAEMTKNSIQAGADGNGLATSLTPTMVVLGVNNFGQTHRISPAEATAAGAPGGVAERFNAWITKASSGKLSPQLAKEGTDIMDSLIVYAHRKAITNTRVIVGNSGLDASAVTVTDIHGNPDTLAHQIQVSTPPQGALSTGKGSDGKLYWLGGGNKVLGPAE